MRFSLSTVLCGAVAVTAVAVPAADGGAPLAPRQGSGGFTMVPHEQAKNNVATQNERDKNTPPPKSFGTQSASVPPCSNVKIRREWRTLSASSKANYVNAIKCLMNKPSAGGYAGSTNRYEDIVAVHQEMVNVIHMVGQFLPWHRYMLWILQDMLRAECGYQETIPWWDETLDAGNFHNSPVFDPAYFGVAAWPHSNGQATCMVSTGVFRGETCHLGPGSSTNTPHCLSRGLDESLTAQCSSAYIATCRSATQYANFETCTEYGPHAYGHNGIGSGGGVMSDVATSPGDPIFFMHHSFVDHSWRIWQNDDYPARLSAIGGPTTQGGSTQLTLNYVLSSRNLRPSLTVGQVMDTTNNILCYKYDR